MSEEHKEQPVEDYDLSVREDHFKINGRPHVLVEASGGTAIKYRSATLAGAEIAVNDKEGTRSIRRMQSMAQVESLLISLCLFEVAENGQRKAIPQRVIEGWPDRVQKDLFARVKKLSPSLEEKEDPKTAKNSSEPIADGSQ